jgi:hypothetical protein
MVAVEDLEHHSVNTSILDNTATPQPRLQDLDALAVGAGFSGCYQLKVLRDSGFSVKLIEAGSNYGGVWHWNRYPGARVDSNAKYYQFSDPELWEKWEWKQRFPGGEELRAYFQHVADVWDLRRDTEFGCFVKEATWDDKEHRWIVRTKSESGWKVWRVKWLLIHTGFAARRYFPDWKGIEAFKGPPPPYSHTLNQLIIPTFNRHIYPSLLLATRRALSCWETSSSHRDRCNSRSDNPIAHSCGFSTHSIPAYAKYRASHETS